ncbi:WD repeat-containing protein 93 [Pitangus sulphuratus]|nr:WD repeat-containing protein 93 [Pitangus sulphuratus]
MAANIRRHPLEIPPPSEKDWPKDDEEDFFLQDPDRKRDALPQPLRMISKLVMQVFESAMEIIERREMLREAQKWKVQPTKCSPTAEFQVTGRANCLAVSGKYIFVGLSVGLAAFSTCDYKEICGWDAVKTEICALHASDLENESHVLLAVDEMGLVWLFCFHKERFLLIKALNEVDSPVSANQSDPKLDLPVLLLTVKPPEPITGSSFESPLDGLKEVDDGSMLGLGYNHLIKDFQWELQEAIFRSTYREYLEAEGVIKEEIPRHATFHFLLPSQVLQVGPDMEVQPDSDLKPDVVWPCAAPIACSAVSSCSRYLALAGEDATITIWDKRLGFPLSVTAILEERFIRSIHFLQSSAAASDDTPCPGTDPVCPIVQLLVLCTDSSYYLVKAPRAGKSSITLLADRPEDLNCTVSAVVPILAFPSAVLIFSWDGTVSLMNTDTSQTVYCFRTPPSHAVASPWQPVFTVDSVNSCLLLRGDKQQQDSELAQRKASHSTIFLFYFNPLKEAFPKEPNLPLKSLQSLPWFERCNVFLHDRQQSPLGLEEPKYWSRLKTRAAAMDKEKQKVKGQKKQ